MQHGLYTSRSSQPRLRLSLSSQKHHGAEPIYLNTLFRLWWSTLSSQIDHSIDQFQFLHGLKKQNQIKRKYTARGVSQPIKFLRFAHTIEQGISYALNGQF